MKGTHTGKEELKLSSPANDKYIQKFLRNPQEKLLELTSEYNQIIDYKINVQNF